MLIKEFENGVWYALIVDGTQIKTSDRTTAYDTYTYLNAGLIIELYGNFFSVIKNRYGTEDKNIPIFLLDDYLNHYSDKFQHKSPILDNFTSTSIADILTDSVSITKQYLKTKNANLADILETPF
jgi:hypothetical protein